MKDLTTREGRQRFYQSIPWRKLREQKLDDKPLCEECLKKDKIVAAVVVDHDISLKHNPNLALVYTNLTSLCVSCHNRKTAIEMGWVKESLGKLLNNTWKIDVTKFKR